MATITGFAALNDKFELSSDCVGLVHRDELPSDGASLDRLIAGGLDGRPFPVQAWRGIKPVFTLAATTPRPGSPRRHGGGAKGHFGMGIGCDAGPIRGAGTVECNVPSAHLGGQPVSVLGRSVERSRACSNPQRHCENLRLRAEPARHLAGGDS